MAEAKKPGKAPYKVLLNDKQYDFDTPIITGVELLNAAGLVPGCYTLYQKLHGCDFEKIPLKNKIDLSDEGIEKFVTKDPDVFHYTLDDEPETTDQKSLSANDILAAGKVDSNTHYLVEIMPDGTQISYKDRGTQSITMTCHPRKVFISILNGPTPVS